MRIAFALLAMVAVPAWGGINVDNHYVSLHMQAGGPIDARLRIHCESKYRASAWGPTGIMAAGAGTWPRGRWWPRGPWLLPAGRRRHRDGR